MYSLINYFYCKMIFFLKYVISGIRGEYIKYTHHTQEVIDWASGIQLRTENKRKTSFYVTARVKKEATAMDGGRFHAEAIFWFCQNSLSKVYMDVHF